MIRYEIAVSPSVRRQWRVSVQNFPFFSVKKGLRGVEATPAVYFFHLFVRFTMDKRRSGFRVGHACVGTHMRVYSRWFSVRYSTMPTKILREAVHSLHSYMRFAPFSKIVASSPIWVTLRFIRRLLNFIATKGGRAYRDPLTLEGARAEGT